MNPVGIRPWSRLPQPPRRIFAPLRTAFNMSSYHDARIPPIRGGSVALGVERWTDVRRLRAFEVQAKEATPKGSFGELRPPTTIKSASPRSIIRKAVPVA